MSYLLNAVNKPRFNIGRILSKIERGIAIWGKILAGKRPAPQEFDHGNLLNIF